MRIVITLLALALASTSIAAPPKAPHPDEEPARRFQEARSALQAERFDEAVTELGDVVTRFPSADVAELAAKLLLDTLNRLQRFDDLLAWVDRMRADPTLLAHRPELATLLDRLHVNSLQRRAEQFVLQGTVVGFLQCAQTHRAILLMHPKLANADEILYNAAICYARANQPRQATLAWQELLARFPKSRFAEGARSRLGR